MLRHPLIHCFLCVLVLSCSGPRKRKALPVSASGELITGCYYVTDDSTGVKKSLLENQTMHSYYLNPQPITTVNDFKEVSLAEGHGAPALHISLNGSGAAAFAAASRIYQNKRLGFVIAGQLVMAPVVYGEINGGEIQITGNFSEEELKNLLRRIEDDMYER